MASLACRSGMSGRPGKPGKTGIVSGSLLKDLPGHLRKRAANMAVFVIGIMVRVWADV